EADGVGDADDALEANGDVDASDAVDAGDVADAGDAVNAGDAVDAGDAVEASGSAEAGDAAETGDAVEASDSVESERIAGEAAGGDVSEAGTGDAAKVAKKSSIFSCLPLDVYIDWLGSNIVDLASDDPELETPALRMPKQLPEAWLSYGLNAANWKEAVRTISRRFRWLESTASAMRRDCRRFVADSSPPPG
ncbi:MAG: hypothetical protein ACKO38_17915, partial [Planctomycetota bacterium]